jgi:hypothetical protein
MRPTLYRLFRRSGESRDMALLMTVFAWLSGSWAEARQAYEDGR